jgi:hypothetical protein
MRRGLAVVALAAFTFTACSGEQGERAQQLLTRAQTAQARLTSATYDVRMSFDMDGQRFSLVMNGGGYLRGPRAGDQVLSMRTEGVPSIGAFNMQMLLHGRQATMTINGRRMTVPMPASAKNQYDWSGTMLDLARYVKRVKVRDGRVVNGVRGSTIAGVIDTERLVKAASKLNALTQAAKVDDLGGKLGDIHAAVFVEQRSGLIRSAVITMSMKVNGKKSDAELVYRLESTNQAIAGL